MKKRTTQDNSQIAQTSNTRPTVKGSLLKSLLFLCLMASMGAWAQPYVFISNETNGYFLKLTGNTTVGANQTYDAATCVWTASNTLTSTTTNYTFSINNGRNRYLYGTSNNNTGTLVANTATTYANFRYNANRYILFRSSNGNNRSVYRNGNNVAYINNNNTTTNAFRYYTVSGPSSEALTVADITGIDNTVTATGTYNLASAASYTPAYYTFSGADTRYYAAGYTTGAETTRPVKTTGFTSDTWTLNKTIPGLSINNSGVLTYNTYVTEDTRVTITHTVTENGSTKTATKTITLKGKIATSLSFTSTSLNMTATTLSLPAVNLTASNGSTPPGAVTYSSNNNSCISVSNTGVLTINGAGTATITANYAANGDYLASSATMTITVANTAAFDETVFGEIAITPSSQTLDLGQQVTYTASESLNSTHRTRPAYSTISTGGNNYYKVGANYQATVPNTNEVNTPIHFTRFNWSAAEGGAYFSLDPYYTTSSNQVTLTRTEQKTASNQTFNISVTGVYNGQNKTASTTVTIPKTQVNPTALHPTLTYVTLGQGATSNITYTYEPNYDAAGETYLNVTFTSNNTSVATVSSEGIITAVSDGSATITLQAIGLDGNPIPGVTATVSVTVQQGTGEQPNNPRYIYNADGLAYISEHPSYHYVISADFTASSNTSISNFTGTLDGGYHTISGLTSALFDNINGGTVKNVRLKNVTIDRTGNNQDAGAIANTATGNSKIYNCGVLSGSVSGSRYVGGLVGAISGTTKVVNNYNYASVSGGTYVAGVVGYLAAPQVNNTVRVRIRSSNGLYLTEYNGDLQIRTEGNGGYPTYQQWDLEYVGGNNYRIKNYGRGDYIAQSGNDTYNAVFSQTATTYTLSKQSDGTYYINRSDGKGFGVDGTTNGSRVYTDKQTTARMKWTLDPANALDQINTIPLMVANCVNSGTEVSGTNTYPVYGGTDLDNKTNPLYDFFLYDGASYRESIASTNGALPAEARFLNRFEYVRATLNAEKKLAAYYLFETQNKADQNEIGKWVLDTLIAPYPVIKPWFGSDGKAIKYPSLVNPDVSDRTIGTLSVNISGYGSVSLPISDQDSLTFDYGYHKVQLPYYNDYFDNNYQANSVVTGWKITSVSGGGTLDSFTKTGNNAYNFADRNCTQKDLFSVSGRVFAQGGYYYVPEGVTGITIEPYWANDVVYLYETTIDKVFGMGYAQSDFGPEYTPTFTVPNGAKVERTFLAAHERLTTSNNVYAHAIVLLGNSNHRRNGVGYNGSPVQTATKAYTLMSIDEDGDNEPDYCQFYGHVSMEYIPPTRLDFVHQVGISWAKKPMGESLQAYSGIAMTKGHYEITETAFARFTEFETAPTDQYISDQVDNALIFNAGLIDQFVMTRSSETNKIKYAILGGHTYFNEYTPGCHATNAQKTKFFPVSVMGGEYESFYLTGRNANVDYTDYENMGRVYTNGGKIGTFAGGYWEQLNGDAIIRFDHTKVKEFYGGSVNPAKPITGNINIIINNCDVDFFCAGPKAGNMGSDKTVTTMANNTKFGTYVGAGYGGSSVARVEKIQHVEPYKYSEYKQTFFNDYFNANYLKYVAEGDGILIRYAIEYMPASGGEGNSGNPKHVLRFSNDYAQLNLARTYTVTSTLNNCTITGNFYGGPWSGNVGVSGGTPSNVTSTLKDCTVEGSVFGGGKSADIPSIIVYPKDASALKDPLYNGQFGVYYQQGEDKFPVYPTGTEYTWVVQIGTGNPSGDETAHTLQTNVDLTNLGTIFGNTILTIDGGEVKGNVYGAGDASKLAGNSSVLLKGKAKTTNVFGGGLGGSAKVTNNTHVQLIDNVTIINNVYGGGNGGAVEGNTEVIIGEDN